MFRSIIKRAKALLVFKSFDSLQIIKALEIIQGSTNNNTIKNY